MRVNARNRDGGDQRCNCRTGEIETVEHLIVECSKYEDQREILIRLVESVIGQQEWSRRVSEEDLAICTVLGLYGEKESRNRIIEFTKVFLTQCWERRAHISLIKATDIFCLQI